MNLGNFYLILREIQFSVFCEFITPRRSYANKNGETITSAEFSEKLSTGSETTTKLNTREEILNL